MATTIPFPINKNFTKAKINGIIQIDFSVCPYTGPLSDMIQISCFNNYAKKGSNNPYPWRTMPASYAVYLKRALFRLELLKLAVLKAKGDQNLILSLKQHLVHLDATLDLVWEEAREAAEKDEMNGNWRCSTLDRWLSMEFHIQRHNDFDVQVFKDEHPLNEAKLNMDPFGLGELSINLLILLYLLILYEYAY